MEWAASVPYRQTQCNHAAMVTSARRRSTLMVTWCGHPNGANFCRHRLCRQLAVAFAPLGRSGRSAWASEVTPLRVDRPTPTPLGSRPVILLGHHGHYSITWSARSRIDCGDAVTPLPLRSRAPERSLFLSRSGIGATRPGIPHFDYCARFA
jgi:hypothetical protein